MRIKALTTAWAAALVLATVVPSGASAATEFGDTCAASTGAPGYTLTTLTAPAGSIPLTAPSDGVITKVRVGFAPASPPPFTIPETVKVLHPTGGNSFTVTQQTDVTVGAGTTTADARMPVKSGDRLGLRGRKFSFEGSEGEFTLYCGGGGIEGTLGATTSAAEPGETVEFTPVTTGRAPVSATIEPDADNDGYGDETQDKCPQSAAFQSACPVILDAFALPKKSSVIVIVNTDSTAPVTVSASVKLPKAAKKATASAVAKLKKVTHTVTPGKLGRFSLKYPASLKQALADLPKGQKLKLKITASATNADGQVSKDKTTVKLKGSG
jgi:hypothetical protein